MAVYAGGGKKAENGFFVRTDAPGCRPQLAHFGVRGGFMAAWTDLRLHDNIIPPTGAENRQLNRSVLPAGLLSVTLPGLDKWGGHLSKLGVRATAESHCFPQANGGTVCNNMILGLEISGYQKRGRVGFGHGDIFCGWLRQKMNPDFKLGRSLLLSGNSGMVTATSSQ